MLRIISAPNPVLSKIAKPVIKLNGSVLKLIKDMEEALLFARDPIGVGLAAPQVGISLQIFIAKPTPKSPILVFINPKIIEAGGERGGPRRAPAGNEATGDVGQGRSETGHAKNNTKLEGCLSLPNIWGPVLRTQSLVLSFLDDTGNKHTKTFNGFMATIVQHETDHLDGILFPKRVLEQKGILYKSHKNEKNEDEFEEIEI